MLFVEFTKKLILFSRFTPGFLIRKLIYDAGLFLRGLGGGGDGGGGGDDDLVVLWSTTFFIFPTGKAIITSR